MDVAKKLNTTTQRLGKSLSGVNVKATETRRAGIAGRYYTFDMKDQIEGILKKGDLMLVSILGKLAEHQKIFHQIVYI